MHILVTGGTGYIGSHTVVELVNAGHEVTILDNLFNSSMDVLTNIEKITGKRERFFQVDLSDKEATEVFFNSNSKTIDAVIHFAAFKAVGESVKKPLDYYHNNITGLINLLLNLKRYQITNFVFSSSCTVYGQPDHLPVMEITPRKPAESPYGNTKAIAEDILADACKADNKFKVIALRYFNPIGAHPSGLIGELPNGVPSNLVPFITQTAAGVRECLSIFGGDYDTPDGTAIRDYIDVVDLAKAHLKAIERLFQNKQTTNFEYFNVGTGNGVSVMEMVKTFIKSTGVNLNYKTVERRVGDIEKIWADSSLSNLALDWKATTPLSQSLINAWQWEKRVRKIE